MTLFSCKNDKSVKISTCNKSNVIIKDTIFSNSEILSSIYYNHDCKIRKLTLMVLLDERSGTLQKIDKLNDVVLTLGDFSDSLMRIVRSSNETHLFKKDESSILEIEYKFEKPFLEILNFIDLKTISLENVNNTSEILKSDSYFYKNSKALLGIENTYLDYSAFKDTNFHFKNISQSKSKIDSILITVKPNKSIDDITKYNIILNDTLSLNFKNSILANYRNHKTKDKGSVMYNLLKNNKDFTSFKLNLSSLNLYKLNSIKVSLE